MRVLIGILCAFVLFVACARQQNQVPSLTPGQKFTVQNAIAAGNFPAPHEAIPDGPGTYEQQCIEFVKTLPADYVKEWVLVPEDYKNPNGYQIKVFYYGKIVPGVVPAVFYNGGPGSNSRSSYTSLVQKKAGYPLWDNGVSFIFIDQRGTGCSESYPQGDTNAIIARLSNYGSADIVRDSEVIRKKLLGQKPWKVFGQSYGAQVVHRYLVQAPEGILSAHAHGNTINANAEERFANRLLSQKRIFDRYFDQYVGDRTRIEEMKKYLSANKCFTDAATGKQACGYGPLASLVSMLGWAHRWNNLHTWITYIYDSKGFNEAAYKDFLQIYQFAAEIPGYSTSLPTGVISYVDRNFFTTCEKAFQKIKERGETVESIIDHECLKETQFPEQQLDARVEATIRALPTAHLSTLGFKEALLKNPNIPFYLYSGDLDCYVPQESFQEEVAVVGNLLNYTNFKGSGHDGFINESLVWENLIR